MSPPPPGSGSSTPVTPDPRKIAVFVFDAVARRGWIFSPVMRSKQQNGKYGIKDESRDSPRSKAHRPNIIVSKISRRALFWQFIIYLLFFIIIIYPPRNGRRTNGLRTPYSAHFAPLFCWDITHVCLFYLWRGFPFLPFLILSHHLFGWALINELAA